MTCVLLFVIYAVGWSPENMAGEAAGRFALLRHLALIFGAGTFVGLLVLAFLAAKPERTDRFVKPLLRPLPVKVGARIEAILLSFLDGLGALGTAKDVAIVAASSLALWALIAGQVWFTLLAFGANVPYPVSFFVLAWAILGLAIPTPGGVGGYHTAVAYALTAFYGVGKDVAGAFALVSHALSFVPITLLGLAFLLAGGLSLKSLRDEGREGRGRRDARRRGEARGSGHAERVVGAPHGRVRLEHLDAEPEEPVGREAAVEHDAAVAEDAVPHVLELEDVAHRDVAVRPDERRRAR